MSTIYLNKRIRFAALLAVIAAAFMAWKNCMPTAPTQTHKVTTLAQLPLSFEVNRGQAAADVKFVVRGGGYALLLTDRGEPILALRGQSGQTAEANAAVEISEPDERALLRLDFTGSNSAPQMRGEEPLPGRSNYLIGNDPSKWLTGVPHYARVRYRDVYSGVDVLYYGKDQELEYDFIVRPGTEPDSIRMKVQGAERVERSESGSLVLKTGAGDVLLHKPVAYQEGPGGETEVACNYFFDQGEIRFVVDDYDRGKVLRIDPVLSYSEPLDALIRAIAVDASGNIYLAGSTASANFPATASAFQHTNGGNADAVIAKLDPTGSNLLFATYLGGSAYDSANGIAIDSSGNLIVAGTTRSANLPMNHAYQSTLLGTEDAFLSKLNTVGTQLLYSTYLGGSGTESALGGALDSSGRAVMTGVTSSSNFPTSLGALQTVYGGGEADAFIAKVDTTKSGAASLLFSTYLGGSNRDAAGAIAVDPTGSVFVSGLTISSNFPTANPLQASCASCPSGPDTGLIPAAVADAFVTKLNATGTALVYSTFLGGNMGDAGNAIALDSVGNAYVAGTTHSWSNFPTTSGAFQSSFQQGDTSNAFVTKLNGAGSALVYSTLVGGDYHDDATGIALDGVGNAYVIGGSSSLDFPTVDSFQAGGGGVCDFVLFPDSCSDAVVAELNAAGSALIYSTYLGHANINESGTAIAVDSAGNAYVAGASNISSGTDLLSVIRLGPPSSGGNNIEPTGFAAKISRASVGTGTSITLSFSPNPSSQGQSVTYAATVTPPGASGVVNFYVDNALIGSATLNAGVAALTHTSLAGGNHSIRAEYLGDATYSGNTSASLTQIVNGISLTPQATAATVAKGATADFPLTVGQAGALASAITFSCSGLPAAWSCAFNPATVPAGNGPTQVTLTVQTGSTTAQSFPLAPIRIPTLPWNIWLGALMLLALGIHIIVRRDKVPSLRPAVSLGFAALLLLAAGCGSGSSQGPVNETPEARTVNFTVSATSKTITSSVPLTITVK